MKIFENNLKQFIDIPSNIAELTNSYITEVEEFRPFSNITNVVVGYVLEKEKHENADTLSVTKVDLGNGNIEQIVCGAPNVNKGQYVIVAKEGAVLPGNFVIKKSKIRGVESNGMICSLKELGIDDKLIPEEFKSGIYNFAIPKELGSNALSHLAMDGFIMELSLTPNRSDLLSHYGFAQDLAAVLNQKIKVNEFNIVEEKEINPLSIEIESKNTNSYYARYFTNIVVKESPWWLKSFLTAMDCKPLNNVVDITNYILYTYGIPMHAFDANKFGTTNIVVKDNSVSQKIVTLDGIDRTIDSDEIVITNGKEVLALGGIMGLSNSMIDSNTNKVILEVASFNPKTIRNTSKKLSLKSDSSLRFERGIDEKIMMQALNHATILLVELADAKVYQGVSSKIVRENNNPIIKVDSVSISRKIGEDFKDEDIINILTRLNYEIKKEDGALMVKAPSYRNDILMNDDVLEEIVRIYGMDNVKTKEIKVAGMGGLTFKQKMIRKIRHYLANIGLNEVVTYSLLREENVKKYNDIGEIITILKPLNNERKALRQSVLNGLIDVVNYNLDRNIEKINLFEIGHVYAKGIEDNYLSIVVSNSLHSNLWKKTNDKIDFYYMSGVLKNIMEMLKIDYELIPSNNPEFHPYQQASIMISNKKIGIIGKLHPKLNANHYAIEFNLDKVMNDDDIKYLPVSKYPNVERDLAIVLKEEIKIAQLIKLIEQTAKKNLVKVDVFDIYKGDHIEKGYQSVAVRMVLNDKDKTFESAEVDKLVTKVVKRIEFELEGKIRS